MAMSGGLTEVAILFFLVLYIIVAMGLSFGQAVQKKNLNLKLVKIMELWMLLITYLFIVHSKYLSVSDWLKSAG